MRIVILAALLVFQFGCGQDTEALISEKEVKLAIEEAARTTVCSGQAQLAIMGIDLQQCLDSIAMIAPACWLGIDKLVEDYRLPSGEDGKERFFDMAYIFNKCVRSELLEKAGRDHTLPLE